MQQFPKIMALLLVVLGCRAPTSTSDVAATPTKTDKAVSELALVVSKIECRTHRDGTHCDLFNARGTKVSGIDCAENAETRKKHHWATMDINVPGYDTGGVALAHDFSSMEECLSATEALKAKSDLPPVLIFELTKSFTGYRATGSVRLLKQVGFK